MQDWPTRGASHFASTTLTSEIPGLCHTSHWRIIEMHRAVQVRSLEILVRQLECEADRNADTIREYLQQIDTLQVGSVFVSPHSPGCRCIWNGKALHVIA